MTVADLKIGQTARVVSVGGDGMLRGHLLDMGITPGISIKMVKKAPLGDPMEILIRGYSLSLRKSEAALLTAEFIDSAEVDHIDTAHKDFGYNLSLHEHNAHPGFGEDGKYHHHEEDGNAIPKGSILTFALAGQQNCGKTTLFNAMTGSKQHVGNFPGVTVDRKDGAILNIPNTSVTDLPGIYSLSPFTAEEIVSRQFILEEKPNGIINIVDASNIERNLYLTLQLMDLGIPMVLGLNMMDELRGNGGSIRLNEMERILGLPVVPISAKNGEGIDELASHAVHVARYREVPVCPDFCSDDQAGGAVHRCIHAIMSLIEDHAKAAGIPVRFAATKLAEGDSLILDALKLTQNENEMVEHIICQMEEEGGLDRRAAIADMRFSFIRELCGKTVFKPRVSKEYERSRHLDKVLTGKWTSIPIFIAIMVTVLWLSIDVLGAPIQDLISNGIDGLALQLGNLMRLYNVNEAACSLVTDGILGGIGAVVSFLPVIIILFFFLSILEDSGYMARVAFVTDRILRHVGLSGRSIVPMLIGLGCTVPAVMAARTLPSASDRKLTIMLTPFMSCSAKITIYSFLASAFFPGHGGLVLACLYLFSILIGTLVALACKLLKKSKEAAPFVMELPNYRMPGMKNTGHLLWDKTKDFLQKAFTVIFIAVIVIWFLQSFNFRMELVKNGDGSILAWLAGLITPLFAPIGLDDWRMVTAFISGFMAKESVVSTMQVLGVTASLTIPSAISALAFSLLYTPCVASISAVKRELGWKWALGMIVFQCAIAWLAALAVYNVALLFVK